MKNIVQCDRCKKVVKTVSNNDQRNPDENPPTGWRTIGSWSAFEIDFCPVYYADFQKFMSQLPIPPKQP